jgi:excisionase family DNA binding protein
LDENSTDMDTILARLDVLEKLIRSLINEQKEFLTFDETCEFLHISSSSLYKKTANKSIPFQKRGRLYFSRKSLIEWVLSNND